MKVFVTAALAAVLVASVVFAQREANKVPLETTTDQASYAIGQNIGRELKSNADLNADALIEGLKDALTDAEPRLTEEQSGAALAEFQRTMQARMQQDREAAAEKNRQVGQEFLAANKKKEDVKTLPSGLQYKVLKSGDGPSPQADDRVKVHYHGTLLDGTVFDSSVQRGEPAVFPVGGVIRGWTEALQRMKVGDKWRLFVPPELAYGAEGAGDVIGPHAVLTFEVELLEIVSDDN